MRARGGPMTGDQLLSAINSLERGDSVYLALREGSWYWATKWRRGEARALAASLERSGGNVAARLIGRGLYISVVTSITHQASANAVDAAVARR